LAETLKAAIQTSPGLKGQAKGPIVPGPRAYAVCAPCSLAAMAEMDKLPAAQRTIVNPRGWLRSDLARHLREYHGVER
jgi:hypothetical protein